MGINGKKLRGVMKGLKKRSQRARSQRKELSAIRRKELFKARKKQAVIYSKQRAKLEREKKFKRLKGGITGGASFRSALGFAKARGSLAKSGIAASVGIKRSGRKKLPKIRKAKRKIKRKISRASPDFSNGFFGGY